MSDSTDARLADNPVVLYELNNLGAGVNGETVLDISGNEVNGELIFTGSQPPWGYDSPIETDAASQAFWGYNNAGTFTPPFTGVSRIESGSVSTDLSGDVSVESWIRLMDTPFPSTLSLCGKGGSFGIVVTQNGGTRLGFAIIDSADQLFVVADTSVSFTDLLNTWVHVVGTRTGNTLAIRVNGELRNTATVTSGLPNKSTAFGFRVHHDSPFYLIAQQTMAALYAYGLTTTQARTHYEADIAATLLSGTANATPSGILFTDVEPDPVNYPFRHNWVDPLGERISFLTGISTTRTGKEEANAARTKPRREIEFTQVIRDNDERTALRAKLKTYQDRKWFIPILEDRQVLTAPLSAGALSIPTSTEFKDYQNGAWIHLRELNAIGQITKSEYLQIQSFTPSAVVPITGTANSYAAGVSEACPARRGYLPPSIQPRGHTAEVEDVNLVARLVVEDEPAVPNRITVWTPTITYKGYEAYDLETWQSNDWSELREYEIDRAVEDIDFETGVFDAFSDTAGAAEAFSWSALLKGKDRIAAFLGWFYYHAGSLGYLWVPSNQRDFSIVSAGGSNLTVSGHIYTEDYTGSEARRDLSFIYNDNTQVIRRINSSTTSGANDVLTLDADVPTQTNLRSVSFLKFCRLDADTLEKALYTDDVMRATWRFRELLYSPD